MKRQTGGGDALVSIFAVLATVVVKSITLLVSYVTNNTFPLPLSEKEEQVYLGRLKAGDEQAKNVLIERNLRLCVGCLHMEKRIVICGYEVKGLSSEKTNSMDLGYEP